MTENNNQKSTRYRLDQLTAQEDKIIRLLREERKLVQKKFPLAYALLATFGVVATWAGLNRIIQQIPILNENPIILVVVGVSILLITGAAYKRLG